jgi:patched 1
VTLSNKFSVPYTYWEQYINLRQNFWTSIGIVLAALVVLVLPFLVNSIAAVIVAVIIFMIVVQIFGLMGLAAIKFSAIPAVALIMSVGMSDQFLDHVTMAFLLEVGGTKDERVTRAMTKMFLPVFEGGMSTMLAILLLGFSPFEFVVKYFFLPFFFVVLVGVMNGLIFLPVVLSLVGPSALGCCKIEK